MPLDRKTCHAGMRVQTLDAHVGLVRWVGRIEKAAAPPHNDPATYAAVEFDYPHPAAAARTDGVWPPVKTGATEPHRYCSGPAGSIEFIRPKFLEQDKTAQSVAALRAKVGAAAAMSDAQLVKFLVARKFDLAKTEKMVTDHVAWRAAFQPSPDECFRKALPDMHLAWPFGVVTSGLAKDGSVVTYERAGNAGKCPVKEFLGKYDVKHVVRWHVACLETARRRIDEINGADVNAREGRAPCIRRVTAIVDVEQLGLGGSDSVALDFAKTIGKIGQDNYPEHLGRAFIINAPSVFTGLWRIVKFFLDPRTKEKIFVLGTDYKTEIAKYIDEAHIPDAAGGHDVSWMARAGEVGGTTGECLDGGISLEKVTADEKREADSYVTPTAETVLESDACSPADASVKP